VAAPETGVGAMLGVVPGVTVWLVTSMGMSRMARSLPRRRSGQRSVTSKVLSPSIMEEKACPPTAILTAFSTSPTETPNSLQRSRSTENSRLGWPRMRKRSALVTPSTELSTALTR
jgi:hypothetical protein